MANHACTTRPVPSGMITDDLMDLADEVDTRCQEGPFCPWCGKEQQLGNRHDAAICEAFYRVFHRAITHAERRRIEGTTSGCLHP